MSTKVLVLVLALTATAHATTVTIVFNTGAGLLTPPTIVTGPAGANNTNGVNLGTNLRVQDPNSSMLAAAIITGSVSGGATNLYCQVSTTANQCAANATSEASGVTGHASGLGVGEGRINDTDLVTITANAGYVIRLISFQVTGMIGPGADQETGFYNLGGSNISFLGGNQAIDNFIVNSGALSTIRFGAPTGGVNGGNTYALHSLTLDITAATPEPSSLMLMGVGLLSLCARRRRSSQEPPRA